MTRVASSLATSDGMFTTGSSKHKYETTDPLTAHERLKRFHAIKAAFGSNKVPLPTGRTELDIIKERHRFIRDQGEDESQLAWEDKVAKKYYESLFREYAVVNLKHYKSGQIGLRWRTEDEVLSGVAHLTCASMRCDYHDAPEDVEVDPDSTDPIVPTKLEEFQVPFAYTEDGEKKSALVKLMLCRKCGKKLLYSHEVKKNKRRDDEERRRSASPVR